MRLIQKWLNAGVMEDGKWTASEEAARKGRAVSPLLANIYLHYVFDLWAEQWRNRQAHGELIIVRYRGRLRRRFSSIGPMPSGSETTWCNGCPVRPGAACREDAPDRVRTLRGRQPQAAGRPAGDLRLPRLHAHVREAENGTVRAAAQDDREKMPAKLQELKDLLRNADMARPRGRGLAGQVVGGHTATTEFPETSLRCRRSAPDHSALGPGAAATQPEHRLTWERMTRLEARWLPTPASRTLGRTSGATPT